MFVDADYDSDNWVARANGIEQEPELRRSSLHYVFCDMRFERTLPSMQQSIMVLALSPVHYVFLAGKICNNSIIVEILQQVIIIP